MLAIDVDAVATRLQDEGATLFVNGNELMGVIASKSATLAKVRETRGGFMMNVLVVDVGGTHVKILATGQNAAREFPSGPTLTAEQMVDGVKQLAGDGTYDAVAIGYPGPVINNRPLADPWNLGPGWRGYDFEAAFKCPVKVVNDAVMQALGSYEGGKMLFLGLGTGLGSAMIVNGIVEPMELGHLPYKRSTFEAYVGVSGYARLEDMAAARGGRDRSPHGRAGTRVCGVGRRQRQETGKSSQVAKRATTPMPSWEDFACGRKRAGALPPLLERLVVIAKKKISNRSRSP